MDKRGIFSASRLFNRTPEKAYLREWAEVLAQPAENLQDSKETSVVIFRLADQWFSLPTLLFSEIASERTINKIPHQNHSILLGVVNLRGQLRLCFSMHRLLEVEQRVDPIHNTLKKGYPRLLAITDGEEIWTFPVEEVDRVGEIDNSKISNVPVNVSNSQENCLKGILHLNRKKIHVIDQELFLVNLKRNLL